MLISLKNEMSVYVIDGLIDEGLSVCLNEILMSDYDLMESPVEE